MLEELRLGVGTGGGSPRTQQEQWQGVERALYKMTKLWEAWGVYPPAYLRVRPANSFLYGLFAAVLRGFFAAGLASQH